MPGSTPATNGGRLHRGIRAGLSLLVAVFLYASLRADGGEAAPFTADEVSRTYGIDRAKARIVADELNVFADSAEELAAYREAAAEAPDEDVAYRYGAALANRGIARLPPATIDTLAVLRARVLRRLPADACARIVRGSAAESSPRILARLDTSEVRRLMSISRRAALAELSGDPLPRATASRAARSWRSFAETLGSSAADRFVELARSPSPSAEELCWAGRQVWEAVPRMDVREKVALVRNLAEETSGRSR